MDFSDFPDFDKNVGVPGTSILWILRNYGSPILFPIPSHISSDKHLMFYPICSAAAILKGKHSIITKICLMIYLNSTTYFKSCCLTIYKVFWDLGAFSYRAIRFGAFNQ